MSGGKETARTHKALARMREALDAIDPAYVKDLSTTEKLAFYRVYTALTHGRLAATDLTRPYIFTTVPKEDKPLPWKAAQSDMMQWVVSAANGGAVAYGLSEYEAWHLLQANVKDKPNETVAD